MTSHPPIPLEAQQALKLLQGYSFDLIWRSADSQIAEWLQHYRASWIRDATIEALYQGRYKAVSVQQILALWKRRGQPIRHFNREFEKMVGRRAGIRLGPLVLPPASSAAHTTTPPGIEANPTAVASGLVPSSNGDGNKVDDASQLSKHPSDPSLQKTTTEPTHSPDNGVLYLLHKPIQPFQPAAPVRRTHQRRPRSIRVPRARYE